MIPLRSITDWMDTEKVQICSAATLGFVLLPHWAKGGGGGGLCCFIILLVRRRQLHRLWPVMFPGSLFFSFLEQHRQKRLRNGEVIIISPSLLFINSWCGTKGSCHPLPHPPPPLPHTPLFLLHPHLYMSSCLPGCWSFSAGKVRPQKAKDF